MTKGRKGQPNKITPQRWAEAPTILGAHELAILLGITTPALYQRIFHRRSIPEPCWRLACGPIWVKFQFVEFVVQEEKGNG